MDSSALQADAAASASSRLHAIDMLRGAAIAGVVLYHLVWDLDFTGFVPPGVATHPLWAGFARLLAGTFMMLVGVNLVLAHRNGVRWKPFFKRTGVIAVAAIAITLATYLMFPAAFVFFGILHAIVVASLVGVLLLRWPAWAVLIAGLTIFILPFFFTAPIFDSRLLAWIGFSQIPPTSNDLVPVFPWLGITLIGMSVARIGQKLGWARFLSPEPRTSAAARLLTVLGRHSLIIYLVHQPILLAIIIPLANWTD